MRESIEEHLVDVLLTRAEYQQDEEINEKTITGVVIGKLVDLTIRGEPLVSLPSNPSGFPLPAKTTVVLGQEALGAEVVLLFEAANLHKPIIVGIVQSPKAVDEKTHVLVPGRRGSASIVECDGEKVVLSAEKEIVLRCGDASITLTKSGKILLKGTYVVSRSSGVNRIKGGSVQIN